jgi:hypothetical protein
MSGSNPEAFSVTVTYLISGDSVITTDGNHTGQPPGIADPPPTNPPPAAAAAAATSNGTTMTLPPITLDWRHLKDSANIPKMRHDHAAAGLYHTLIGFNLNMAAGDLLKRSS